MPFRGKKDNRQNQNRSNLCLIVISAKEGKTLGKEEMGDQGWVDMGGLTEQGTFTERHVVLSSEMCGFQAEGPSLKTVRLEEPGVLEEQLEGSATIKVWVWGRSSSYEGAGCRW